MVEVGLISSSSVIVDHINSICREFDYSTKSWSSLSEFMEAEPDCRVVIVCASEQQGKIRDNAAECCQVAKAMCNDAFVVCIVEKAVKRDQLPFLKKSGADLILNDDQLIEMSKLEFLLTQELKVRFIPIKLSEIRPDSEIDFHIYHLVPHRGKFLPCSQPGLVTSAHLEKLRKGSEFYINRRDLPKFRAYLEARPVVSAQDLLSRCRVRFLSLCVAYAELVFLLTDQAELGSFERGTELVGQCKALCSDLVSVVAEFDEVWDVIDHSAIGNLASVERSTAVATYVAVFGLRMNPEKVESAMVGALMSDIGLLFLNSKILKKMRSGEPLLDAEYAQYIRHPMISVDLALERKLQVDSDLRKMISMTHERDDGKGFPDRTLGARIPFESHLIQFCQELDARTLPILGEFRRNPRQVRAEFVEEAISDIDRFGADFCHQLEKAWGTFNEETVRHPYSDDAEHFVYDVLTRHIRK